MGDSLPAHYTKLCAIMREAGMLGSVKALLQWDEETYMPAGAGAARAEQLALMAAIVHRTRTDPAIADLLERCERDRSLTGDPTGPHGANIREMRRDYDLATRVPADLVGALAKARSEAQLAWRSARETSDWGAFTPHLDRVLSLTRRKAECLSLGGELYDALLDEYEPGATAGEIEGVFTPLRRELAELIASVRGRAKTVSTACLKATLPAGAQHAFGLDVLRAIGFDLSRGRLDTTTHPFCEGMGPGDTRLTTRYRESSFTDALFGTLHEAGHGMYEQGLPKSEDGMALFGQPLADAVSLGIHESQSRLWENFVGRSKEFWRFALPLARKHFGAKLSRYKADDFHRATNTVTPSLIRVEADECTYNLHVMIRFELERAMIRGELRLKDVPGEWNKRYLEYLGVKVPDHKRGCMQDVHWSAGLIGYFPTYTLGNLHAAQMWEALGKDLPDLRKDIAKGRFTPLRQWLNEKVHLHGRRYRAGELCRRVTGRPLDSKALLGHLRAKVSMVYGV